MLYTIDTDYNVTAFDANTPEPTWEGQGIIRFSNMHELTAETANWPMHQFVAVWNGFAGAPPFGDLRPVKKFENATIARKRIFAAIEKSLASAPTTAATAPWDEPLRKDATVATIVAETNDMATKTKKTTRAKRTGKAAATTAKTTTNGATRKETILALIGRKKGATIGEIMEATGWQKHSVRGFIATLNTKGEVSINSSKNSAGERVYQGVAGA